jgi:DNA-binding CsgD family transcriptional regulator
VENRLGALADAERALLEAMAVGEPLGTAELAAVADVDVAGTLERQGLLVSRLDGRRLQFRLAHPLHGEVLRGRIPALRGRGLARTLAEAVEAAGARREDDGLRAGDDTERGLVAVTRFDNLRLMGRFADASLVAEEAESAIADPEWRDELVAKRAGILLDTEGPSAAVAALGNLQGASGERARAWVSLISTFALSRTGRVGDALQAAGRGQEAIAALGGRALPWPPGVLVLARAEALAVAGRTEEAEALAAGEYQRALDDGSIDAQAYSAWQLAKVLLAQGRAEGAARHGREASALLRQLGRRLLLRDCLATLASAEALRGRAGRAAEVLAEFDALNLSPSRWTGVDLLQARAWSAASAGDLSTGRAFLEEAVSLATGSGDRVGGASALHDLARLGRAKDVAERLSAAAGRIEGELAPARAAHATALARGHPGALEAVSVSFEALGARLLAAEAAADAAVAWRRRGNPRAAVAAESRAASLAERCEGATTPALQAIETRALLTPAEREVALLAAAGRPNKEIADQLGLSLRTVENRLHRIYEKLGISGRPELAAALEG